MSSARVVRGHWARRAIAASGLALAGAALAGGPTASGLLDFSASERQQIQRHGPWPPAPAHDAGNAQAGRPAAIALGRQLFFDPRLSPDGRFACASSEGVWSRSYVEFPGFFAPQGLDSIAQGGSPGSRGCS